MIEWSHEGDTLIPGQEPVLAPGVRGTAFDTPKGIYIPLIRAEHEGRGDVGAFIDSLPKDRRIVFPCVISARLAVMLERRGFTVGVERGTFGEAIAAYQRCPR